MGYRKPSPLVGSFALFWRFTSGRSDAAGTSKARVVIRSCHDARKEVGLPTETWEVIMKPFLYVLYQDLMSDHGINKFKCDVIVCKQ